jgi:hypothetical protein
MHKSRKYQEQKHDNTGDIQRAMEGEVVHGLPTQSGLDTR